MSKSKEFWDKSADNYDKTEERFEHIHQTSRESAKEHLEVNDVVLDYGCGTGTTACELASHVKEIRAIDISPRMIELSQAKAASLGLRMSNLAWATSSTMPMKRVPLMSSWRLTCSTRFRTRSV